MKFDDGTKIHLLKTQVPVVQQVVGEIRAVEVEKDEMEIATIEDLEMEVVKEEENDDHLTDKVDLVCKEDVTMHLEATVLVETIETAETTEVNL
jgi:hypothetical protein